MKARVLPVLAAAIAGAVLASCSASYDFAMGVDETQRSGTPQDPPLPRTESVLPLEQGNRWVYTYTVYDTSGVALYSQSELSLEIPAVYGRTSDTTFVTLTWSNYDNGYVEYVYEYEWYGLNEGYLVTYRDLDVPVRGVYIVGEYIGNQKTVYDSAQLWLAYPAAAGSRWQLNTDPTGDADSAVTMQVVSTSRKFYFPNNRLNSPSPLQFLECYLYKQTQGDIESYYYYNEEFGAVGYLRYEKGKLARTYILESFVSGQSYYY